MKIHIAALSFLALLFANAVSAAFELSPPRSPNAASGEAIVFASNGDTFLGVIRTRLDGIVHGVTLDRDGGVSSVGDVVSTTNPISMARFGDHYLLASADESSVQLTEVTIDGAPLRTVATLPYPVSLPIRATTDGEHVLVSRAFNGVIAGADGSLREVEYGPLPTVVGSDDDEFFVTFFSGGTLLFRRLRVDGSYSLAMDLGVASGLAAAASDGTDVLVVTSNAGSAMQAVRITPSGAIDARPIASLQKAFVRPVSLVWTGSDYVLVALRSETFMSELGTEIVALRLSSSGSPIGDPSTLFRGDRIRFDGAAFNGSRIAVAVTVTGPAPVQAYSLSVAADDLAAVRAERISVVVPSQVQPEVASSGRTSLVVWSEPEVTSANVKAALLGPSGRITATDLEITNAATIGAEHAVAYAGGSYLVVWREATMLRARRISESGDFLDAEPITIATDPFILQLTSIATDGDRALVVSSGIFSPIIRTAVIDAGRVVATHSFNVTNAVEAIDVAYDGSRYLVSWLRPQSIPLFPSPQIPADVAGAFFDRDGALIGNEGIFAGPLGTDEVNVGARPGAFLLTFVDITGAELAALVSGTSAPVLSRPSRGPDVIASSKPVWTGSQFVSGAVNESTVMIVRRDENGQLLSTRTLSVPLANSPEPPLIAGEYIIVQQKVFSPGQVAGKRLVVYRESEFATARRRIAPAR